MLSYRKKIAEILVFVLLISSLFSSCKKNPTDEAPEEYIHTADINATLLESDYMIEKGLYDIYLTDIVVTVPAKKDLSQIINGELTEWEQYAIDQIEVIRDQLEKSGSSVNVFELKKAATYNENGILSIACFIEYSEHGESYNITVKSGVWDLGTEKKIPVLQMLKMSKSDYENYLTINLDHSLNIYPEQLPHELKNAAGKYSEYIDYYIDNDAACFYITCENIDYRIHYMEFKLGFTDDPHCFNYKIAKTDEKVKK